MKPLPCRGNIHSLIPSIAISRESDIVYSRCELLFEHCVTIISTRDYRIANTLLGGVAVFVLRSLQGLECQLPSPSRSEMVRITLGSGIRLQQCPKIFSNSRQKRNLPCFLCWPWRRWRPSQRPRWAASWPGRRGAGMKLILSKI